MTTSRSEAAPVIAIVAAVVTDEAGRVLLVRKRGTSSFMLPGGKPADGEEAAAALAREVREELGCGLAGEPVALGRFAAPAANEPGHWVEADLFLASLSGEPRAGAELAELVWHPPDAPHDFALAPLAREHVLPLVRLRRSA